MTYHICYIHFDSSLVYIFNKRRNKNLSKENLNFKLYKNCYRCISIRVTLYATSPSSCRMLQFLGLAIICFAEIKSKYFFLKKRWRPKNTNGNTSSKLQSLISCTIQTSKTSSSRIAFWCYFHSTTKIAAMITNKKPNLVIVIAFSINFYI